MLGGSYIHRSLYTGSSRGTWLWMIGTHIQQNSETILWGGIPGVFFTPSVTDEEFVAFVRQVLAVMRKNPKYVLGVADQVPPDGLAYRVAQVRDLVETYGRYE